LTRFLFRRLLLTIPVLFGVATLVFSLIHLVPGDHRRLPWCDVANSPPAATRS
jgi:ABC-type dipeptide/oligopeptide/nickel transport system permease component